MAEFVTQAEYGRLRGISRQRVGQLAKSARIVLVGGKVDVAATDAALAATDAPDRRLAYELAQPDLLDQPDPDPARVSGLPPGGEGGSFPAPSGGRDAYREVSTELQQYRADLVRMDRDERAGALVSAGAVESEFYELGQRMRDAFRALPHETADQLAVMSDPAEIRSYLSNHVQRQIKGVIHGLRPADASRRAHAGA